IFLEEDKLLAILPENHRLTEYEKVPLSELCTEPFMLLEKGAKAEISEIFEKNGLIPNVRFTTWDDYAVMSMIESGLGVSILPQLIMKRIPYNIVIRELDVPAYRNIGIAFREKRTLSLAVKRFLDYLDFRYAK
ncbi:MAG: LysR family transcriptional regulator substrate-binding protein, partial [Oscillospiraceae bacterium]|nr:LysR family transcriptional regulator substrate-binding protein [Oscillospiraceae bacterium]